ncbi:sensor histidine kinase [Corynebacterium lujinxingii]|uniref:Sensor histidine kinase n=1 Tax=Corynebacterium lujinxingii TaxID=2763010 RepID=A0A7H0JYK9_9CORY|nr:sensor histidine kinase [Corynebacterium lujinxingii]MBC3178165.1 sensor histidine kinase [Corynebacterium lujinxingii]NNO10956.1 sensor histidine kinase [Corynebacterium lujinxingii]NNO10968.1 sensor histidine kinase [Corynebacterium lujinxingii]QNP90125.1 sensor histidine kinase [Corynebacterium lujinxingii]
MSSRLVLLEQHPGKATDNSALDSGITILAVCLMIVSLGALARMPLNAALLHILLVAGFAFLLFYGMVEMYRWGTWGRVIWAFGLTALWVADTTVSPVAVYWVFVLFFVYLRAMRGWLGYTWVAAALAISVAIQIPVGLTLGGVMGPALSAVVVLAIDWAFFTINKVSQERQQLIDELLATRDRLAETERAAGVAQERERLAHEIHDTVAQNLSSIQMLLHAAERDVRALGGDVEQPLRKMETARRAASNNLAETRAMIAALAPAPLTEASLREALERVAGDFAAAGELDVDVDVDGEAAPLPMRVEAGLLRIAQGAVSNVVNHAEATRARITLTYGADEVRLDVVDNGRGFDVAAQGLKPSGLGHLGLDAMRSRAEELGGTLEIESAPGGPTALSVAVPVTINRKTDTSEEVTGD